jgi:hypothetical protein
MLGFANALLGVNKSNGTEVSKKRKAETVDDGPNTNVADDATIAKVAKVSDEKHNMGPESSMEMNSDVQDAASQSNTEKQGEIESPSKSQEDDELEGDNGGLTKETISAKEGNEEPEESGQQETKEDEEEEDESAENLKENPYDRLKYCIVENDGKPDSCVKLIGLKSLFSKQLPKMPRTYIARLVFDRRHKSLAILSDDPQHKGADEEIIGAICYRGFYEMRFAEIAFCAVNSSHQVKVRHSNTATQFSSP